MGGKLPMTMAVTLPTQVDVPAAAALGTMVTIPEVSIEGLMTQNPAAGEEHDTLTPTKVVDVPTVRFDNIRRCVVPSTVYTVSGVTTVKEGFA